MPSRIHANLLILSDVSCVVRVVSMRKGSVQRVHDCEESSGRTYAISQRPEGPPGLLGTQISTAIVVSWTISDTTSRKVEENNRCSHSGFLAVSRTLGGLSILVRNCVAHNARVLLQHSSDSMEFVQRKLIRGFCFHDPVSVGFVSNCLTKTQANSCFCLYCGLQWQKALCRRQKFAFLSNTSLWQNVSTRIGIYETFKASVLFPGFCDWRLESPRRNINREEFFAFK